MKDGSDTRARIERAAMELFVAKGVRETTIRDIAARAGVSEGALYRHHSSKDDLVWALFASHYADLGRRLDSLRGGGIDGTLGRMVETFCRLHDDDPVLFGFLLLVQHGQLSRLDPGLPSPVEAVRGAVEDAVRAGEIPPGDCDVLTAMVMGIVLQAATFKLYGRLSRPMGALAPTLTAACRAAVRAR